MKKVVVAVTAAIVLAASAPAFAWQAGIYISPPAVVVQPAPPPAIVVQPAPPPAVVVPAPAPVPMVQYQYYPAYNIYFDPTSGMYWSLNRGRWVLGPLPGYIYPGSLGAGVVVAAPNRPWRYYRPHPHPYPHGHY